MKGRSEVHEQHSILLRRFSESGTTSCCDIRHRVCGSVEFVLPKEDANHPSGKLVQLDCCSMHVLPTIQYGCNKAIQRTIYSR